MGKKLPSLSRTRDNPENAATVVIDGAPVANRWSIVTYPVIEEADAPPPLLNDFTLLLDAPSVTNYITLTPDFFTSANQARAVAREAGARAQAGVVFTGDHARDEIEEGLERWPIDDPLKVLHALASAVKYEIRKRDITLAYDDSGFTKDRQRIITVERGVLRPRKDLSVRELTLMQIGKAGMVPVGDPVELMPFSEYEISESAA